MKDNGSRYLTTKEDNAFWYRLDPESFPYMNPDLMEEEEERLDSILRFFGENI